MPYEPAQSGPHAVSGGFLRLASTCDAGEMYISQARKYPQLNIIHYSLVTLRPPAYNAHNAASSNVQTR